MKRLRRAAALSAGLWLATAIAGPAQVPTPVADVTVTVLSTRLFPGLANLARPAWSHALAKDAAVEALSSARALRIAACQAVPACIVNATIWTDQDRAEIAAVLKRLVAAGGHPALAPNADLAAIPSIDQELVGLNGVLKVYGAGLPSRYPLIDGPVFASGTANLADSVKAALDSARAADGAAPETIEASVRLAAALLDANDATAAIRFEPLDERENAGARLIAARTNWSAFRYTALVIPGVGPEDAATALSPRGKLHVLLAAQRYAQGLAPFILVTGSAVHPRGTRFVEAVEMRRALVDRYHVPAERIILEPYARHTTTNLRNATRRLAALHIPIDRPTLIVTDAEQSRYIEDARFGLRNRTELGYEPGMIGRRLSPYDIEFRPAGTSLRQDPRDPLDP